MAVATPGRLRSRDAASNAFRVGLLILMIAATTGLPTAIASAASTVVAQDNFARHVTSGLGKAPIGGAYRLQLDHTGKRTVSLASGALKVSQLAPGGTAAAYLNATSARDVDATITITAPAQVAVPVGLYTGLVLRRNIHTGTAYRMRAVIEAHGVVGLRVSAVNARGVERPIGAVTTRLKLQPGHRLHVEAQVVGSSQVTLSLRAWSDSAAVPRWNMVAHDHGKSAISTAGSVGLWNYQSQHMRPVTFTLSGFRVAKVTTGPAVVVNAPAPPTGPVPAPGTPPAGSASASAGSAAVGSSNYAIPTGALYVSSATGSASGSGSVSSPLSTVAAALAKAGPGQTIVLRGGTYHEDVSIPASKSGLTIQAYPHEAVWFDGTTPVTTWTQVGSTWVHSGWTAQFDHSASFTYGQNNPAFINPAYPMAAYPDQVYLGSQGLTQVATAAAVTPGTFAVDYATGTITIGSDPTGQSVRASDLVKALSVGASHVSLLGFGVRHYANPLPALGAVWIGGSHDLVQDVVVTGNSTEGLMLEGAGDTVNHVTALANGMTGIHANEADGLAITASVADGNNTHHFNSAPSAAGIKITRTRGVTVSGSDVSNNIACGGIWTDESVVGIAITGDTVDNNGSAGIHVELSNNAVLANNTVTGEDRGMLIVDSGDVSVFNNYFANNTTASVYLGQDARREADAADAGHDPRQPIPDPTVPWLTTNIAIANNVFASYSSGGQYQIFGLDWQTNIPMDAMHVSINGNSFNTRSSSSQPHLVGWGGSDNRTVVPYDTPAALAAAKNSSWMNVSVQVPVNSDAVAVALPSAVAAAIGEPAGTAHVGTFS